MCKVLFVAAVSLSLLAPSASHAFCFLPKYYRGHPYLERLTEKARALPKREPMFHELVDAGHDVELATFEKWLVKELNSDSLLIQQMLPVINESVIQNGRASSYIDTYVNGDGVTCERLLFSGGDLKVESAKLLEERKAKPGTGDDGYANFPSTIYEVVISVRVIEPAREDNVERFERFSFRVEAKHYPSGQDPIGMLSYPQWVGEHQ